MTDLWQELRLSRLPILGRGPAALFWTGVGVCSVALGAIGAFLPVLPTAPFAILAAFAFRKGSPRFHAALTTSRMFGPLIADWRREGAIPTWAKMLAMAMMAATLTGSLLAGIATWALVVQAVCMGAAALFVLTRPAPAAEQGRPRWWSRR